MAETLLLPYLVTLLFLPLLVRWRWGLIASLATTIAAVGLVALVFYLLEAYRVFPDPYPVGRTLESESSLVRIRRGQAHGYTILVLWGVFPACVSLLGGALAIVWQVVLVVWRASRRARD
jgi:hypothetical protein